MHDVMSRHIAQGDFVEPRDVVRRDELLHGFSLLGLDGNRVARTNRFDHGRDVVGFRHKQRTFCHLEPP